MTKRRRTRVRGYIEPLGIDSIELVSLDGSQRVLLDYALEDDEKPARPGHRFELPLAILRTDLQNHPDDTQEARAERLGVDRTTVYRALKRLAQRDARPGLVYWTFENGQLHVTDPPVKTPTKAPGKNAAVKGRRRAKRKR